MSIKIEEATDRQLMVVSYQLSAEISQKQKQLNAVQNEIDKRVHEYIKENAEPKKEEVKP